MAETDYNDYVEALQQKQKPENGYGYAVNAVPINRPILNKLKAVYEAIDHVEKKGKAEYGKTKYDYLRAVDVARAVREAIIKQGVIAAPSFTVLRYYTFTTSGGTVMNAVDVSCDIIWHDVDSNDFIRTNGLGSGSDTTDKAIYKAMTGSIKYALRSTFLVPDESDPEAEGEPEQVKKGPAKPNKALKQAKNAFPADSSAPKSVPVPPQANNDVPTQVDTVESTVTPVESTTTVETERLPVAMELAEFYNRAKALNKTLTAAGLAEGALATFITKTAGVSKTTEVSFVKWNAILGKLEEGVKTDVNNVISKINYLKGEK